MELSSLRRTPRNRFRICPRRACRGLLKSGWTMLIRRTCQRKHDEAILVRRGTRLRETALSMGLGAGAAITACIFLGLGFAGIALGVGCGGGLFWLIRSLRPGGSGH